MSETPQPPPEAAPPAAADNKVPGFLNKLVFVETGLQFVYRVINPHQRRGVFGTKIGTLGFVGNFPQTGFIQPRTAAQHAKAEKRLAHVRTDADGIDFDAFFPSQIYGLRQRKRTVIVFSVG